MGIRRPHAAILFAASLALAAAADGAHGAADTPATPPTVAIASPPARVRQYERLTLTLRTNVAPDNPYDPGEADLRVTFTGPGGRGMTVPAFWYKPFTYERRPHGRGTADWIYPAGAPGWRACFAAPEPGTWTAVARVTTAARTAASKPVTVACEAAPGSGYVRVSKDDPRFLALDDGSPFFAVGQNVAFVKDTQQTEAMLQRLGEHGANFARVWACCEDWGMAVEAPKSGWRRSWGPKAPVEEVPGPEGAPIRCLAKDVDRGLPLRFTPTRPLAVRPETRYVLTGAVRLDPPGNLVIDPRGPGVEPIRCDKGWLAFSHPFVTRPNEWFLRALALRAEQPSRVYLAGLTLREAGGGPDLLWEAKVSRPPLGRYNQVDAFILDRLVAAAEASGVRLQLVMAVRDHYMRLIAKGPGPEYDSAIAMAKRLARYFVARWGYSTHVAAWEYFNEMNPGLPTERFYDVLGQYLEEADPYRHLRATSYWHSPSKAYRHPRLDTADMHHYMQPRNGDLYRDAVATVLARAKVFREHAPAKPAVFSEFGLDPKAWKRGMDPEFLHLHNALWASALSGLASTVCHWFWDEIHARNLYGHYRPVADFVADIPFTTGGLEPARVTVTGGLRVVGLQGKGVAYLWLSDPEHTWHKVGVEGVKPKEVRGAAVTVAGLAPGTHCVRWWDTWAGKVIAEATARPAGGRLTARAPAFTGDVAVKIEAEAR